MLKKYDTFFNIYILSDLHICTRESQIKYAKSVRPKDIIIKNYSGKVLHKAVSEILRADNANAVIFLGDLVHFGEETAHKQVLGELERLRVNGIEVFVLFDTHDRLNWVEKSTSYSENQKKLYEMYAEYGWSNAISIHNETKSYLVELGEKILFFALNTDVNPKNSNGIHTGIHEWLKKQCDRVNEEKVIICGIHRPMRAPDDFYAEKSYSQMIANADSEIEFLAENGVNLIISGHTHIQCDPIGENIGNKKIYTMNVGAAADYACVMNRISINIHTKEAINQTIYIPNDIFQGEGEYLYEHCYNSYYKYVYEVIDHMDSDFEWFQYRVPLYMNPPQVALDKEKWISLGKWIRELTPQYLSQITDSGYSYTYSFAELITMLFMEHHFGRSIAGNTSVDMDLDELIKYCRIQGNIKKLFKDISITAKLMESMRRDIHTSNKLRLSDNKGE